MTDNSNTVGIEKLDKDNFQPWKFRMRNYLMGKDLRGYVTGEYKEPELSKTNVSGDELKAWKTWNEKDKRVMFLISQNVSKDALGSIGAQPDDDDLVSATLNGLKNDEKWRFFSTSVYVRENFLDSNELKSLMIIEERNMAGSSKIGNFQQNQQNQNYAKNSSCDRGRGNLQARGSLTGSGGWQQQQRQNTNSDVCWICGRYGHYASNCYQRNNNRRFNGSHQQQQGDYASISNNDNDGRLFVMQHMMSAIAHDASANDVWYVSSCASNHMTFHQNWFSEMKELSKPSYVEIGDDTMHLIEHVENVLLSMDNGKDKYMADVLHVPTITKNLVLVGKMVEQGLQVRFNEHGCFVEDFKNRFLDDHGIKRQFTCRYAPQQNGVAERKNRYIAEVAQALMNEKEKPEYYWAEAVHTSVYIMNRTPTAVIHGMTPEERFTGKNPKLSHLKVFGCLAYVHIPDELRFKMDPKAKKCVFIGYSLEKKGYQCYNLVTREIKVSRDVVFDELNNWYGGKKIMQIDEGNEDNKQVKEVQQESTVISGPKSSA
ncbi:hypothetical protein L7F22_015040 [Adiantum nelumboides]|nr:hypothetical protein [Adiantum nelumboides]